MLKMKFFPCTPYVYIIFAQSFLLKSLCAHAYLLRAEISFAALYRLHSNFFPGHFNSTLASLSTLGSFLHEQLATTVLSISVCNQCSVWGFKFPCNSEHQEDILSLTGSYIPKLHPCQTIQVNRTILDFFLSFLFYSICYFEIYTMNNKPFKFVIFLFTHLNRCVFLFFEVMFFHLFKE